MNKYYFFGVHKCVLPFRDIIGYIPLRNSASMSSHNTRRSGEGGLVSCVGGRGPSGCRGLHPNIRPTQLGRLQLSYSAV